MTTHRSVALSNQFRYAYNASYIARACAGARESKETMVEERRAGTDRPQPRLPLRLDTLLRRTGQKELLQQRDRLSIMRGELPHTHATPHPALPSAAAAQHSMRQGNVVTAPTCRNELLSGLRFNNNDRFLYFGPGKSSRDLIFILK